MSDQTTETQAQDIPMLTVDGQQYPVDGLPDDIKELISIYQSWDQTLKQQKVEAFKTEAAMRAVSVEIETRIRSMVAAAGQQEATPETTDQGTPE